MTGTQTVQCPCCKGTGVIETATNNGLSQVALLRRELIKIYGVIDSHEMFVDNMYETTSRAITELVAGRDADRCEIARLNQVIANMSREIIVYKDKPSNDTANTVLDCTVDTVPDIDRINRREYRHKEAIYEAEKNGTKLDVDKIKKKTGGQLNHKGFSRMGTVDGGSMYFDVDICNVCGSTDMEILKIVRKRIFDLVDVRSQLVSYMYVIRIRSCRGCGALNIPHTDAIPGTSLGPLLRLYILTFKSGHATIGDICLFLKALEDVEFSEGTISACLSAITNNIDGPVLTIPKEKPIALEIDLRGHRSPLPPVVSDDTKHGIIDADLTQHSNLCTSSQPQSTMVNI